ncbi:hypothetical protein Ciccas_010668 [Cichlidogyrus casuarinus]|uniref:Uncharacterized protein n=1 Tax=Cichlidogyrus casuarinus TaxID=1844966 RepID=A0ABD2PU26_9PLAT
MTEFAENEEKPADEKPLKNLQYLYASHNEIEEIPPSNWSNLIYLNLDHNKISKIAHSTMPYLQVLMLNCTYLTFARLTL